MTLSGLIGAAIDFFYVKPLRRVLSPTLFRYGACGALNMALDAVWYFLIYHYVVCQRFVDVGFVVISTHIFSLILVFPITFFTGFWLNGHVAFRHSVLQQRVQLFRYALSIVGSLILTYVGLKFFVEVCGIWPTPSKVITTLITVVYSFLVAKYFTFRGCSTD